MPAPDDRPHAADASPDADVTGIILEIEEFAVHDGPGIRTVVFCKGCPLCCTWCHNPEGIDFGARRPEQVMSVDDLARRLLRHAEVLAESGGGVTFSGGEPLSQPAFVIGTARAVRPLHVAIETSGQASAEVFRRVTSEVDLVMMDVKHTDAEVHRRFTGHTNRQILRNLSALREGSTPFIVRVPLIPGVNDDDANLEQTARLVAGAPALRGVELLPYNTMAPAKYGRAGRVFQPGFDTTRKPRVNASVFESHGIRCDVL